MTGREQRRLRWSGLGLIAVGAVYVLAAVMFFRLTGDTLRAEAIQAMDQELAAGVDLVLPAVAVLIAVLLGGFSLLSGAAVILCACKPDRWLGALIAAVIRLIGEISKPTILTILPVVQIVLGVWLLYNALAIRKGVRTGGPM